MEVTASSDTKYQVKIQGPHHELLADEPESVGGTDLGPSPFELLLGSLAACTAMTVRMYAERKQWPLEQIDLTLRHEKVSANACDDCLTLNGKVDVIHMDLHFEGDLTDEQLDRLKYIAGRCPVHRTLISETRVRMQFK